MKLYKIQNVPNFKTPIQVRNYIQCTGIVRGCESWLFHKKWERGMDAYIQERGYSAAQPGPSWRYWNKIKMENDNNGPLRSSDLLSDTWRPSTVFLLHKLLILSLNRPGFEFFSFSEMKIRPRFCASLFSIWHWCWFLVPCFSPCKTLQLRGKWVWEA